MFGISVPPLLLPVGISFYTFQNLSYVIDAYRGTLQPERHFGHYALFVAYFPQLVAGPIERPQNLLPQLHAARNPTAEDAWAGAQFLLRGYCKKLVLADFAARFVDPVYAAPDQATGPAVVVAHGTVCPADLRRFLRLLGHCLRRRPADGGAADAEL